VIEVQQEAFAAVEEAEAEEVVPEEGEDGDEEDVPVEGEDGAADAVFGDEDLCAEGGVAVHVLEVTLEVGIGMVNEVVAEGVELALEGNGLVDGAFGEACGGGD
jgi:hypothetical protein